MDKKNSLKYQYYRPHIKDFLLKEWYIILFLPLGLLRLTILILTIPLFYFSPLMVKIYFWRNKIIMRIFCFIIFSTICINKNVIRHKSKTLYVSNHISYFDLIFKTIINLNLSDKIFTSFPSKFYLKLQNYLFFIKESDVDSFIDLESIRNNNPYIKFNESAFIYPQACTSVNFSVRYHIPKFYPTFFKYYNRIQPLTLRYHRLFNMSHRMKATTWTSDILISYFLLMCNPLTLVTIKALEPITNFGIYTAEELAELTRQVIIDDLNGEALDFYHTPGNDYEENYQLLNESF